MEKSMKEEWKPVRGYEEFAEISNLGQIHYYAGKSKRYPYERWTYGSENDKGYLYATIGGKSFRVNRLVYMMFVGDIPKGMEVNHIDENKHNNCVWNLNLMTRKENVRYGTGIERSAAAKSKAVQALDPTTLEVVYEFASTREAERQFGFAHSAVAACCLGKHKTHKGFIWRFIENKSV